MATALLTNVTTPTTGTGASVSATNVESVTTVITAVGDFTANISIQSSPDNTTWTTVKQYSITGARYYRDVYGIDLTSGYIRAVLNSVTGNSTTVSSNLDFTSNITDGVATQSYVQQGGVNVYNLAGLKPFYRQLIYSHNNDVIITGVGDSLTQFGGDVTAQTSDPLAETDGYLAHLRRKLNNYFGLSAYDGGQWIPADAVASDTRVTNQSSPTIVPQFNPFTAYRNSSSVITYRSSVSLAGAGQGVTFTFTGRYCKVLIWENNANGYNGNFTYSIDGGGASTYTGTVQTDTYKFVTIDCATVAAHTVAIAWSTSKVLIAGAMITNGKGVSTARFGVGGTKAQDWTGYAEKVLRTSLKTLPSSLTIIRFSYNDWNTQVANGVTPTNFATNIQSLITSIQLNSSYKSIILLCDPPTSTADTLPYSYSSFKNALIGLANGTVCFIDLDQSINSDYSSGNSAGYYVDAVHRTSLGYQMEASVLASVLTCPAIISA